MISENALVYNVSVDVERGAREAKVAVAWADGSDVSTAEAEAVLQKLVGGDPVPMLLTCPARGCGRRHVDEGEFATKVHTAHACQFCGHVWRPAVVPTVGVRFLPGFKNGAS